MTKSDSTRLGAAVKAARNGLKISQSGLAKRVGYTNHGPISKIESGALRPDDDTLRRLEQELELPKDALVSVAGKSADKGSGIKRHRDNQRRITELTDRTRVLSLEVERRFRELDQERTGIQDDFLTPALDIATMVRDVDPLVLASLDGVRQGGPLPTAGSTKIGDYQRSVAHALATNITQAAASGVIGGVAGAGVAAATYAGTAAWATASTGAAISSLSGAAASSATLASLGGGSLAAGGLGMAGGTVVLASIVAAPAAIAAGVGLYLANRKLRARAQSDSERIDEAERQFMATEKLMTDLFEWIRSASAFYTVARKRGTLLLGRLNDRQTIAEPTVWDRLDDNDQQLITQMLDLVAVVMTVLPLPVVPDLSDADLVSDRSQVRESVAWNRDVLDAAMDRLALAH
jgi:transcriptional regulator with XRE-family HTH domain